ncbi:MLP-like protein 43 [Pyrus ussuriensis x Pyrus communis]|uniref:MLP-like protein 43 n=1 Tax=Pyrus ussuriensis x Pyrus communis TaxID=2448454 RepID=A0A5N5HC83_9ROSA|nr:MLP-like protein 43 [Pyrus ussuriensis x Pyrus communis]
MSNSSKVETSVEIKSEANRFHEFFARTPYEICNISPDKVPSHKLLEGEWGKVGCVFLWDYIEDGKPTFSKELTEAIDDVNHSVTFTVLEGNPLDRYKSFKITLQVTPKLGVHDEGSVVNLVLQYEKLHDAFRIHNFSSSWLLFLLRRLIISSPKNKRVYFRPIIIAVSPVWRAQV